MLMWARMWLCPRAGKLIVHAWKTREPVEGNLSTQKPFKGAPGVMDVSVLQHMAHIKGPFLYLQSRNKWFWISGDETVFYSCYSGFIGVHLHACSCHISQYFEYIRYSGSGTGVLDVPPAVWCRHWKCWRVCVCVCFLFWNDRLGRYFFFFFTWVCRHYVSPCLKGNL